MQHYFWPAGGKSFLQTIKNVIFVENYSFMKKIFLALTALVLFTGCDDGDMTFKTFNFSENNIPAFCTDNRGTIYLINGTEVLLFKLDTNLLLNVPSPIVNGIPQATRVAIGSGTNRMYYRTYSNTPNTATFCGSSGTPNLVEEWPGNGTLLIITTEVRGTDGKLTGYQRQITIESATFSNGEQEVTITANSLRAFTEILNYSFDFPEDIVATCSTTLAYKTNSVQSLELYLENPAYLSGTAALEDINLNDDLLPEEDNNNLYFRKFNTAVTRNNICSGLPSGTVQTQLWRAISGTVKIIPTPDSEDSSRTDYEIRLYNAVFENGAAPAELYSPENTTGLDYYLMGKVDN